MRKLSLMEKLDDYRLAVRIFGPKGIGMVRAGRFGRIRGRRMVERACEPSWATRLILWVVATDYLRMLRRRSTD